MKLISTKCW